MPRIRFQNLLLVPEGPPDSVWERAMDAVYAAAEHGAGPEESSPDAAAGSGTEDADVLAAGGNDSDSGPTTHEDGGAAPAWNAGQGPDGGDGPDGSEGPDGGDDVGGGLSGDGNELGY